MMAPAALAAFAVLAALAGPRLLRDSCWPARSPKLGIIAWQALSGSVLLAAVLAGVTLALPALPVTASLADLISACAVALRIEYSTPAGAAASVTGAVLAAAILTRATYCLTAAMVTAHRARRRQLRSLKVTCRRPHCRGALVVVQHDLPAAYCLPGWHPHVVVTTAAIAALDEAELAAVLAHERAHLRGRHHLVIASAGALQRAFPRVPVFRDACAALDRLVEMAADDAAVRHHNRRTVASALVRLAEASTPAAALGAGGATALARVRRLLAPAEPIGVLRSVAVALGTGLLLVTPIAITAAPAVQAAAAEFCPIGVP